MAEMIVKSEICKGCGLCIEVCPKKILSISNESNSKGYCISKCLDLDKCTGCAFCARICPDVAITIKK